MDIKESFYRVMDKLSEGAEVTMKQLKKKFDAGTHEAMNDPKPGYHVELRNTKTGKRTTHYVKEEAEQIDEISQETIHSYYDKAAVDRKKAKAEVEKGMAAKKFTPASVQKTTDSYKRFIKRGKGMTAAANKMSEEIELEEDIDQMSSSKLKYHALNNFPHGSYTRKEIQDEHKRRMRTEPNYYTVKPSLSEEVEQLDEIGDTAKGRKALKAVIARAPEKAANLRMKSDILGRRQFDPDVSHDNSVKYGKASDAAYKRYQNTVKGAARAVDRLTKEEVEQIDEISQEKLGRYYDKAASDRKKAKSEVEKGMSAKSFTPASVQKTTDSYKRFIKRGKGMTVAAQKMKEEVEQIDELSKQTLGSYIRKAATDTYYRGQDVEAHTNARNATDSYANQRRHAELTDKARRKANNRIVGIDKASHKLTKEEADTSSKETVIKSVKPHVTTDTTTVLPSDVKPQRVKLAQFKKLFN